MGKRSKYTEEFKREAVVLVSDPGVTLSQVARELGISTHMAGTLEPGDEGTGQIRSALQGGCH